VNEEEAMNEEQEKPFRYKTVEYTLSFWQSVGLWIRTWEWKTTCIHFVVVYPDSPDYETAPFESAVLFARDAFTFPEETVIYKK